MTKSTYMRAPSGEVFSTENPEYHKECENLGGGAKGFSARQEYAAAVLRTMIGPGQTVHCILRKRSASGMSRDISFVVVHDGVLRLIDALVADVTGRSLSKTEGVKVGGCGMDMGFSVVYALGAALWPAGTDKPHGARNGEPDSTGGYALKSSWL